MTLSIFTQQIMQNAKVHNQRTGQYLFNHLPSEITYYVSGRPFDPFHKDLTAEEVYAWMDNHLVFDGNEIVGVFDGDRLLWEKPAMEKHTTKPLEE